MTSRNHRLSATVWMGILIVSPVAQAQDSTEVQRRANASIEAQIAANRAKAEAAQVQLEAEIRAADAEEKAQAARNVEEAFWNSARFQRGRLLNGANRLGLDLAEVSDAIKAQVGLPDGKGVVVVSVLPGSPGAKAGFEPNDLLMMIGSDPATGVDKTKELLAKVQDRETEIKIIRSGKQTSLNLAPDNLPRRGQIANLRLRTHAGTTSSEYWIGVQVSPVDVTLRSHLTDLPADAGLIVNDVLPDTPAAKAGLMKNDVLVSLADKPLTSNDELIVQVRASEGKPVSLVYLRGGKMSTVSTTPEKHDGNLDHNPHETIEKHIPDVFFAVPNPYQFIPMPPQTGRLLFGPSVEHQATPTREVRVQTITPGLDEAIKELNAKVDEIKNSVEAINRAVEAMRKPEQE